MKLKLGIHAEDISLFINCVLAQQSRRLVGELLVYGGIRPIVHRRPSHISHIASVGRGNEKLCFCSGLIRTLVAMATYISHRLIM